MSKENQNAISDLEKKKIKSQSKKNCQVSAEPRIFALEKSIFHEAKYL